MSNNLITEIDILDESKECFLAYTEEVLTDRAIPSAEDGLLSVHRKLLWTMTEILKMTANGKFKKADSEILALQFYAPIYTLLTVCDRQPGKEQEILKKQAAREKLLEEKRLKEKLKREEELTARLKELREEKDRELERGK